MLRWRVHTRYPRASRMDWGIPSPAEAWNRQRCLVKESFERCCRDWGQPAKGQFHCCARRVSPGVRMVCELAWVASGWQVPGAGGLGSGMLSCVWLGSRGGGRSSSEWSSLPALSVGGTMATILRSLVFGGPGLGSTSPQLNCFDPLAMR